MLWAIYILFGSIVCLILYLVYQSFPTKPAVKNNASLLIEALDKNRMVTCQGDVVFCYRLHLPEGYSLAEEEYDQINEIWRIALKDLPQRTIVMRSDRYDRRLFDSSHMPDKSYIQREERKYAATRDTTCDTSYLFVVFTGFRSTRNSSYQNPFIPVPHGEIQEEDRAYNEFVAAVDSMYQQIQGSEIIEIEPMAEKEIYDYTQYFYNGFQNEYLTDVDATGGYIRAGDHYIGAVSIEHERQFPEKLRTVQPGSNIKVPVGSMEDLGIHLTIPHIYNQIITISGHGNEYDLVKRNLETISKNLFTDEDKDQEERLKKARREISDDLDAMLVRGHTNIIFWGETVEQVKGYRTQITNYLKQKRDFEPVVPAGVELRNVVFCSHPATVACMNRDSYYLVDIKHTVALFQSTGGYADDMEGVYYSDPVNHQPRRYDLYDAHKKYVDSRNIAVIGRTGGGKTVNLEKVVESYHNDPAAEYVNIIIDCGGSYDKAARLYNPDEVFIFRYNTEESLGIDPFSNDGKVDSERIDDVCETLWLIIKPDGRPTNEEKVSLRKIATTYLKMQRKHAWVDFYEWVRDNYQQIIEENDIRPAYFDVHQFLHNGSEWCDGGIYGNVFAESDNPTSRLQGKKLLIFELENIRSNPQLLSIVVHLIGFAIRTLIWDQPGKRGFIIYEEFAELMKLDMIFGAVLYQMQAIRKRGGSACIVLQNLSQLALNASDRYKKEGGAAKALMENIETIIFLAGADPAGFEKYAPKFSEHDRQSVLALKNNYTKAPMYSSFYIYRSKKSALMTLCVSPRTYLAFQTEGDICNELGSLYAETKSMETAIECYEQKHLTI